MALFPLTLAVASKEGLAISDHFGHARAFRIYEVSPNDCYFLETRTLAAQPPAASGTTSMAGILETIQDCHAVFVSRVANGEAKQLEAAGIEAVADYAHAPIDDSLLDYASQLAAGEEDA